MKQSLNACFYVLYSSTVAGLSVRFSVSRQSNLPQQRSLPSFIALFLSNSGRCGRTTHCCQNGLLSPLCWPRRKPPQGACATLSEVLVGGRPQTAASLRRSEKSRLWSWRNISSINLSKFTSTYVGSLVSSGTIIAEEDVTIA